MLRDWAAPLGSKFLQSWCMDGESLSRARPHGNEAASAATSCSDVRGQLQRGRRGRNSTQEISTQRKALPDRLTLSFGSRRSVC